MFFRDKKFQFYAHQQAKLKITYKTKGYSIGARLSKILKAINPKKLRPNFSKIRKAGPELLAFLFICLAVWTFLQSARIGAIALEIKEKILLKATGGAGYLEEAKGALFREDLELASLKLVLALKNFKQSQETIEVLQKNSFGLGKVLPQSRDAEKLLQTSVDLTEAGKSGIKFLELFSKLSFGTGGLRGETTFNDLAVELENFDAKLKLAQKNVKNVSLKSIPEEQRGVLVQIQEKLSFAISSVATVKQMVFLGQTFFDGQKKILLLMQNQNELRPTGGFIGSFGIMELVNGRIESLKISSVYDLDGQLNEKILPPTPLLAVNPRWFLRDANWFTDFKLTAKKLIAFYEKEGGETPDLTIALTPKVISDLLNITGPIKTQNGINLTEEVFLEQLQVLTQSDKAGPSNEPKKILSEIFTGLFQKIGELESAKKPQILQSLQHNLANKQILLYSQQPKAQEVLSKLHWSGEILESDRDYLLISSANLGGTKTDESIEQNIKLESKIGENGEIENTLTLIRANKMPNAPGGENKSFIRIYVPMGSKFKEAAGFDLVNLEKPQKLEDYKADSDIFEWEKSQVRDVVSGTLIGNESGKTFFGNWVILKGGETKTITLKYLLPFKIKNNIDRHSLLLQKQPGVPDIAFDYEINFPGRRIEWQNFQEGSSLQASRLALKSVLNKDQFFGMVLNRNYKD